MNTLMEHLEDALSSYFNSREMRKVEKWDVNEFKKILSRAYVNHARGNKARAAINSGINRNVIGKYDRRTQRELWKLFHPEEAPKPVDYLPKKVTLNV